MAQQTILAAEAAGATDMTTSSGDVTLTRAADRRYVRVFATVTGGTATITLAAGMSEDVVCQVTSATGVGEEGIVLSTDAGPFNLVEVGWSSNTGTVAVEAVAF